MVFAFQSLMVVPPTSYADDDAGALEGGAAGGVARDEADVPGGEVGLGDDRAADIAGHVGEQHATRQPEHVAVERAALGEDPLSGVDPRGLLGVVLVGQRAPPGAAE